ncbi:putative glycoside hydrolase family 15 protein [Flagellimonas eckloniae]|uniref:Uncharacterized protein n=1 Tax=Flagellimonas eckloniae TaxID=346185 RepID=A0A0Q0XIY0_9FLAO|nr:putative glycoside hydrolase family 15 protein [Allomuricauda eckloniae]KQC28672.1 hypothetical protein AAY42_01205 [Allomuricauda eckloniae]
MRKINLIIFTLLGFLSYSQQEYYPNFSWDKVPVAFHFGKRDGLMTKDEAKFVTSRSNFIVLEKAHGAPDYEYTEDAIAKEARKLKKLNPGMKVIFYWNSFLDYNMYKAHEVYQNHPQWWLRKQDGELDFKNKGLKRYDLSNPKVRDWWTDVAKNEIVNGSTDGIFMDAFIQVSNPANIKLWGQKKYNDIQQGLKDLIKETREKLGDDKLIVYNGIRSTFQRNVGNNFPDYTDVVMIEHFGHFASTSKESMLTDIQEMEKAGKSGKIVVFKAWPGFAWIDKEAMSKPYVEKQKIAKNSITFPLAAFLAGAQEHSYFIYNWGYRMEMGCLEWYPEFDKPLGKPLNDMVINGWVLTREYEHALVWVNLETNEAKINWK